MISFEVGRALLCSMVHTERIHSTLHLGNLFPRSRVCNNINYVFSCYCGISYYNICENNFKRQHVKNYAF